MKYALLAAAGLLAAGTIAAPTVSAAPVTPTSPLTSLPGATFGGSGIPTDAVAVGQVIDNDITITIGLTAHQRFTNPPLANDGAGTFLAGVGSNFGDPNNPGGPGPSSFLGSTWNFAYYVDIAGGDDFSDYDVNLFYDLDAGIGTDFANLGRLDVDAFAGALTGVLPNFTSTRAEDSQNLLFAFLTTGVPGFVDPPAPLPGYDPDAPGEYSFVLQVTGKGEPDNVLGQVAINVNVPEPATIALLLGGLAGLGLARRRRVVA